ncbi:MAG: DHH family phosphoesterase [Paludibacter sp.]|nr:DHH family phosphoesterase [Paludibacter sp.]
MISKIIAEELVHKAKMAIDEADKIAIVVHVGPDGDAMGASLAMWHYLMTQGKTPVVVVPTAFPDFYAWMPGAEKVLVFENEPEKATEQLQDAELILALDFNVPKRMGDMSEVVINSMAKKIIIDHHLHPGDFAEIVISYPEISSTSELVFRLICRMGHFSKINQACAECIYTGMMSDTGGFTYNSNDQEIYIIIAELIKIGVDKDDIYRKVFNTYSEHRLRLMGYCLYQKMKVYPEYKAALITLTATEMQQFSFINGDSEGFVNIPLSIAGVDFSVFMREDLDKVKISLRSQGTFPANKFAGDVFNGGGHLNASGGEFYGSMEEAVKLFEEGLPGFKDFL